MFPIKVLCFTPACDFVHRAGCPFTGGPGPGSCLLLGLVLSGGCSCSSGVPGPQGGPGPGGVSAPGGEGDLLHQVTWCQGGGLLWPCAWSGGKVTFGEGCGWDVLYSFAILLK